MLVNRLFDDLWTWSVFSEEKKLDFNGCLFRGSDGTVLIDPPHMEATDWGELSRESGSFHILLTNKDHLREAPRFRDELGAQIWIHEADADLLGASADVRFEDGERLPGGLRAVHVPDNKSPGETAFHLERHGGVLILGDALIGDPPGRLRLLPEAKYADVVRARQGLRVLLEPSYEVLLVGDGTPIRKGGREAVRRFLEAD